MTLHQKRLIVLGPNFSFSVDTRGKEVFAAQKKKKKTPSTLRRDARRREELLRKKLNAPSDEKVFKCDQCDNTFKSENGLKIHVGKSHKNLNSTPATPDRLRQQPGSSVSFSASPLLDTSRDECSPISPISVKCDYCEEAFNCEDELQKHKAASCRKRFMCVACNVHCFDLGVRWKHDSEFHR